MSLDPLAAALDIGRAISAAAYWDEEGRICNWLGRIDREGVIPGSIAPATGALEADLYRGSTGVALFLAELAAVVNAESGEKEILRAAQGGLRRSLRQLLAKPLERASPLSFFLGHLGTAWVARRLLDVSQEPADPEIAEGIERLLDEVRRALGEAHPLDLLGGSAGAIPVLLALARAGHEGCLDLASQCGEELRRSALRQGAYVQWPGEAVAGPAGSGSTGSSSPAPLLTGLSHGASGIALALLELHGATCESALRDLARGAFAYEDSFYSPPDGNWRDPREAVAASGFQTGWCHGAPGIALARLRALRLDPELQGAHAATARLALGTTAAALERGLARPRYDATLCHGLAGLSEVLLTGGVLLGEATYRETAGRAMAELIRRHAAAGDWPTGVPSGGPTPAFMLGTAGIGHHLLRLHDPARVPPVLLLPAGG